ncbi:thiamine pyrophosphate-binding protein [Shimazuella sp. AN120528]|nr:thiamine pyrophosphate-binding protein [Shimazuella soli]MCH5586053.1 thiamine pyrophosphate-binding protein [Shimazuella soli]
MKSSIQKSPLNQVRSPQSMKSVADIMLEQLTLWGVKRIYGVVGDAIFGLLDAISKQSAIQFIQVQHESVAAMMASAEAKLTGGLGVCTAQMGPGIANLMNGLGDAYLDHSPVLAITGQAPLNKIGTDYKQYINQQQLVKEFTRSSTLLTHPDTVVDVLVNAMKLAQIEGTVTHLSVPKDLFTKMTSVQPYKRPVMVSNDRQMYSKESLKQVIQMMRSAKKPMIIAGIGAKSAGRTVEQLTGQWGAGLLTSLGAKGMVPDTSVRMLGGIGEGGNPYASNILKQADVVLMIGTTWWPEGYVPIHTRVIQIEKHAINIGKGPQVEMGVIGQPETIIPILLDELKDYTQNPDWVRQVQEAGQSWALQNQQEGNQVGSPIPPSRIIRALEKTVSPDSIITLDEGDVTLWFYRNFRAKQQQVLISGHWRTMGFGLPAALAAKLCRPDKQVVAITGDGGLNMVLGDLLTAIQHRLKITLVVFNNKTLQMEEDKMKRSGLNRLGVDLVNPDYVALAKACGWEAYRADSHIELEETLQKALTGSQPTLVDVNTASITHPDFRK